MNKRILLASIFVLIVAFSIGSICASDVNTTDSYATNLDESSTQLLSVEESGDTYESAVDNDASGDVLQSNTSSTLSTNAEDSNALSDGNSSSSTIELSKTVTAKDVTKYYKGSTKYTATFLDENGTALANTNVKITVKTTTYTVKTDSKGVASLNINLKPGTYKVVAVNPSTGYSLTTTFKILSTITASNVNKVYLDTKKFSAKFYNSNGKVLAKKTIKFKINGKTYKVKTSASGIAKLSLKYLNKGTYKIISYNTDGLSVTNTVKVIKTSKTTLTTKTYYFLKSDSKTIKVKLLDQYNTAPSKGKIIKFKVNGKIYSAKTNANGVAKIKLPSLKAGTYNVKYKFTKTGNYKTSTAYNKVYILPSKTPTFTVKSTKTFGHGAGTSFKVALTSGSVPIVGKTVTLSLNGNTYTKTTSSSGIVSLPINLDVGTYTISYKNKALSKLNSKTASTTIKVVERGKGSIAWKSSTSFYQGTQTCKVYVADSNNKAVSGGTVKLTLNSKTYSATTASNGYASFSLSFSPGTSTVSYNYAGNNENAPVSNTTTLQVKKITTVSVNNVISAAKSLNTYYQKNKKLPSTVTAGGISFTVPEFLYLMNKAIVQLDSSNTNAIAFISGVKAPSSPSGSNIASKLLYRADYVKVAKNVVSYISTNKQAPNYASSAVGNIIYEELVDASARILAFYPDHDSRLPGYVTITYSSGGSGTSGSGLNEDVEEGIDLSQYLKSTKNCDITADNIVEKVKSLTSKCTTVKEKATAIYNFVRDSISYSFYYNTKYGASKTLSVKAGNCVDQAHLLNAMFRAAKIPSRYVHGTCVFSSGNTYGHVWTQVLINGKWTVADPTSSRNSLGKINNWDTGHFTLKSISNEITF